jgi:pentapeptide MXKDX repeat protein
MRSTPMTRRLTALGATLTVAVAIPAAAQASNHAMKHPSMKHHHAMKHHAMKHHAMKKS